MFTAVVLSCSMSIYPEGGGEASDLFAMWLFALGGGRGSGVEFLGHRLARSSL